MKLFELEHLVREIYKYFKDQKVPAEDVLDRWLVQVEHVPASAVNWILDNIKATRGSLPANLPRIINQNFEAYRLQPDKMTKVEEHPDWDCPDCHGAGVLHFKAIDRRTELKCTYAAICSTCKASWKKFGRLQHEGGHIARKTESGTWIHDGPYVPPMLKFTKQEIIDKGYEFLEPENKYAPVLKEVPDEIKYSKLVGIRRDIRKIHHEDLTRQAQGLIDDDDFTKHEAIRAVNQAVELRAKIAIGSDNPGDIIKELFNI